MIHYENDKIQTNMERLATKDMVLQLIEEGYDRNFATF